MRNFHIIAGVEVISGRNLEFFVFVEISSKKVTDSRPSTKIVYCKPITKS